MTRFKPLVIALNGPPQIGKGWLAEKLTHIMPFHSRIMSIKQQLINESLIVDRWDGDYADYKLHTFEDGLTGREHMFELAAKHRARDPNYYTRALTESRLFSDPDAPIIILDDLGFPNERQWLSDHAERILTCVIAPTRYSPGCIWENDIRVCLHQHQGGIRALNSDSALRIFKERLTDAESCLSTNTAQRAVWFDALMGKVESC